MQTRPAPIRTAAAVSYGGLSAPMRKIPAPALIRHNGDVSDDGSWQPRSHHRTRRDGLRNGGDGYGQGGDGRE